MLLRPEPLWGEWCGAVPRLQPRPASRRGPVPTGRQTTSISILVAAESRRERIAEEVELSRLSGRELWIDPMDWETRVQSIGSIHRVKAVADRGGGQGAGRGRSEIGSHPDAARKSASDHLARFCDLRRIAGSLRREVHAAPSTRRVESVLSDCGRVGGVVSAGTIIRRRRLRKNRADFGIAFSYFLIENTPAQQCRSVEFISEYTG
jgi:hypothetical protein